jgi:glycosyltransferase involved in cell wall biosynthesis
MVSRNLGSSRAGRPTLAIDFRMSRSSGIGVYLRHVVAGLVADFPDEFRIVLLGGEPFGNGVEQRSLRSPIYSAAELVELPLRIPRDADVVWSPNYNAPLFFPGKLVVTVHDACHLAMPELLGSRIKSAYARFMFANVARRAARVIAVSRFTADELTRLTPIARDRISVVHSGVDAVVAPDAGPSPVDGPFILYVGNVKPHKNLSRLLTAFASVQDRIPHRLVIVGRQEGLRTPDHAVPAIAGRVGARVEFTGEVSGPDLRRYYANADLLVFPSLYEGFGFPPLEAMTAGVPVAAADSGSIPEVCGDAVAYFDPWSVPDIAATILDALTNDRLRSRLRAAGTRQVQRFSWKQAVEQTAAVFRDVVAAVP